MSETAQSVEDTSEQTPMKFCRECGEQINAKAKICPECGVRQRDMTSDADDEKRAERAKQYLIAGGLLGFAAILILPIVFAPLAALCGVIAMYYGRPLAGAGVVAWAFVAFFIGLILGFIGLGLLAG